MYLNELNNQSILVTGASDGIGWEIARHLMKNGARVAIHYNRNKQAAQALLNDHGSTTGSEIFQADLADTENCLELWHNVMKSFGELDAVVLNAGVYLEQPIEDKDKAWIQTWKRTIAINLDSVGILTKKALQHFKHKSKGRLVYIASRAVFRGETEEYLGYAASKGGLVSLARSVARSFGKHNIKSFVIAPGFVRTAMANQFIETYGEKRVLDELALTKLTEPKDVSPLVALMCSGLMDHATGSTIDINAGSHIR